MIPYSESRRGASYAVATLKKDIKKWGVKKGELFALNVCKMKILEGINIFPVLYCADKNITQRPNFKSTTFLVSVKTEGEALDLFDFEPELN